MTGDHESSVLLPYVLIGFVLRDRKVQGKTGGNGFFVHMNRRLIYTKGVKIAAGP
jgi:hypothetical protein